MNKSLKNWLFKNKASKEAIKLLFLAIFFLSQFSLSAQIIAGDTALGQVISDPLVNLTITSVYEIQYSLIDLDCDSVADIKLELYKSSTAIDGANTAYLKVLNPLFEICADTFDTYGYAKTVNYYNETDTLFCLDSADWQNDTIYRLGDYGCVGCIGPWSVDSNYVTYKNTATGQQGWIKLSFDLYDAGGFGLPITLSVPEVLSPCVNTALPDPVYNDTISDTISVTCGIFTFDAIINPVSCYGNCDGSIEIINLTGGTSPYSFMWISPLGPIGPTASNLCIGNLTIYITDDNGVSCQHTFFVPESDSIQVTLQSTSVSCFGGSDGSLCVSNITGGTAPYTYMWNDPSLQLTQCAIFLIPGVYTVCVVDSNGCTVCATDIVFEPTQLVVTDTMINASCLTCNDGGIQIFPSGGTVPYTYLWMPTGGTTPNASGLIPGTYNYCVTDSNGCIVCDSNTVSFVTNIQSNKVESELSVFPNPTKGVIKVSCKEIIENIVVRNVLGEIIKTTTIKEIDISNYPNGVYFIEVIIENRRVTEKVLLLR
ncbi:MAG: hypothetical protein COB15_05710 [Flavobacteriales bacterium]|nr:MAG: hypothetical protein COB15_05710 [Flavobacteriales bacterium]